MKRKHSIARGPSVCGTSAAPKARISAIRAALARAFSGSLLALPALIAAAPAGAAVKFTVIDLGTFGGTSSNATGINAAGQVVGYAATAGDTGAHAFLWQSGAKQDLGTLGGGVSYAYGINDAGQVVGDSSTSGTYPPHAFLWQGGKMQNLGSTLTYAYAGINAAGQVAGTANVGGGADHAYLWQSGTVRDLGTLGGIHSYGGGINDAGQVVGYAYTKDNAALHAFLWQSGTMRDLGTLGGTNSAANGINATGQVVGSAYLAGNAAAHAYLWQAGTMQDLGTLGGTYSAANGINAVGQVVGNANTNANKTHAFLTTGLGGMTDLNDLLVTGSGVTVTDARDINDSSQIVGQAVTASGQTHAVVLTPTGAVTWMAGGGGGSFSDAANWEQNFIPNKLIDATITPAGSQTIHADKDAAARSLSIGSALGGSGRPQLILQNGARMTVGGGVTVQATGMLGGDGTVSGSLSNLGTVRADNLTVTGTFTNARLVHGNGYLNANLNNAAGGVVSSGAGQTLHVLGTAHNNAGTVEVSDGGALQFGGTFNNAGTGRVFLKNGQVIFADGVANAGQINVTFGTSDVHGGITTSSGGKVILSGNSNTTFYDSVDVQQGGELRVSSGSTAVFFGLVQQRAGSIFSGTGTKFYEGGLSVGASPGLGTDDGNVAFGSGNVYLAEIGGLAAATGFDKYEVAGTLGFGGTLKVVWWGGFAGEAGQRFDLFDWGSSQGAFSTLDLTGATLASGLTWDTSKLYSNGELSITAVPEPQTWALLLMGLVLTRIAMRQRAVSGTADR